MSSRSAAPHSSPDEPPASAFFRLEFVKTRYGHSKGTIAYHSISETSFGGGATRKVPDMRRGREAPPAVGAGRRRGGPQRTQRGTQARAAWAGPKHKRSLHKQRCMLSFPFAALHAPRLLGWDAQLTSSYPSSAPHHSLLSAHVPLPRAFWEPLSAHALCVLGRPPAAATEFR